MNEAGFLIEVSTSLLSSVEKHAKIIVYIFRQFYSDVDPFFKTSLNMPRITLKKKSGEHARFFKIIFVKEINKSVDVIGLLSSNLLNHP